MQQSNGYIIMYAVILTVVCGTLLAFTAESLKPLTLKNIELEKKKNILATVMELESGDDIEALYKERVRAYVVDAQGNKVEGQLAEQISIAKEYKEKPAEERLLPVYEITDDKNPEKAAFYVLPLYGYGLWDNIWGFMALQGDLNTVQGVKFDHKGETPGLGARIATDEIQNRYAGKKIYDGSKLVSVYMVKGEGNQGLDPEHEVDGMSGATITGVGLSEMLANYLGAYDNFLQKQQKNRSTAAL